jgi:uncharacterized membrane protein YfcA
MCGQCGPMPDGTLIFIAAVFALAGFVKGVTGLGLPTISMGLLAIVMPPIEAAAILILPSLLTNVWQMVAGPSLWAVVRRLWPTMLAVCVGTWAGVGLMTEAHARYGTALLGSALAIYALTGIGTVRLENFEGSGAAPWTIGWGHHRRDHRCNWRLRHPGSALPAGDRA